MSHITRQILLQIVEQYHPASVGALRDLLIKSKIEFTDEELVGLVGQLSGEKVLVLGNPKPDSFMGFLAEYDRAPWLYPMILLPLVESFLVLYPSQEPVSVFLRVVLGLGLLGFMPGHAAVRALFPREPLSVLEKLLLSIFLSVIISISLGTILGSVFLFEAGTNVLLLSSVTILFTVIAGYRTFTTLEKQDREIAEKANSSL